MANLRSAGRLTGLLAILAILLTAISSPVGAQDDDERLAVVEIEQLRTSTGAATVPIRVVVESRRAVEAELEVRASSVNMSWRFPLALAANTEVQQIVIVPTDLNGIGQVEVSLFSGNDELADARVNDRQGNENAVGLLGIEAPGAEVVLRPDIGRASLIELNDLRLLPALDSLVVTPASMRALAPGEQDVLLSWVWSGKQLLVAAESGSIDEWLPSEVTGAREHELLGAGIVRYVGRDWDDKVAPGISTAADPSFLLQGPRAPNSEIFNDGGFSIPSLTILTLVLLAYVLIAGPVAFIVLTSTNRQSMAWVVLPAIALLFTGGIFISGKLLNDGRSDAYAAIVEVNPVGGTRTETLLEANSGRQILELPENYSVVATGSSNFRDFNFGPGAGGGGTPITQRPSRTTTELEFRIDAGSGGTVVVSGNDASVANQLAIDNLAISNGSLTGSVRNASPATLEQGLVLVANRIVELDPIASGASVDFELSLDGAEGRFAGELREWDVDPRNRFNFDGRENDSEAIESGPVNGTSWLDWRASKFGASSADGLITAVGWSRDLDGLRNGPGRTALVARAQMPAADGPVLPAQLRTLRSQVSQFDQFGGFVDGPPSLTDVAQFVRPPGSDTSQLAIEFPQTATDLSVWVDDEWRWFEVKDDTGRLIAIPENAWVGDTLTVRMGAGDFDPNPSFLTLKPLTDATEVLPLAPPGEERERRNRFEEPFFDGPGGFGVEAKREVVSVDLPDNPTERVDIEIAREGFIEGEGFDSWVVPLVEGDDLEIQMNKFGGELDPFLVVLEPGGNNIAENDDGGGNLNSLIGLTTRQTGEYVIEARPLGGGGFGEYELIITISREPREQADG